MPYTLMKGLLWILLAVLLGVVVGWLLRSVAAKRQIERARSANSGEADQEEIERLRARVANLEPIINERDRLRSELAGERGGRVEPTPPAAVGLIGAQDPPTPADEPGQLDLEAAASSIGKPVALDDLTVIEGIGPKIAELCRGIGITTWAELSTTEISLLRTMLNDAGQRFKAHDPSTWPQQAGLLAAGSWAEFSELTDRLDGGRAVD